MIVTGPSGEAPFQCHLERDVLSPTSITLMEAGTQVFGHYKSVVCDGQDRVVAVTASAVTPNGVVVPLGGPIADQLGAAGVQGLVDNHWWQRIGAAVVLSLVDNGFGLAQAALSKGGSTYLNFNTGGGGWLARPAAAGEDHQHPADDLLNQGTRVALWVTKFIDFSDAYQAGAAPMSNRALRHLLTPFLPFLANPETTEVVVNRPGEIGVESGGVWSWHQEPSLTFDRLDAIGMLAAFNSGQDIAPTHPLCGAALPDGERIQVCRPPATRPGTISITIRRPPSFRPTLQRLADGGLFRAGHRNGHVQATSTSSWTTIGPDSSARPCSIGRIS